MVLSDDEAASVPHDNLKNERGKEIKVDEEVLLSNQDIDKIGISRGDFGDSQLSVVFNDEGKSKFYSVTKNNIKRQLAVVKGDKVLRASFIMESIKDGPLTVSFPSSSSAEETIKDLGFCPYFFLGRYKTKKRRRFPQVM